MNKIIVILSVVGFLLGCGEEKKVNKDSESAIIATFLNRREDKLLNDNCFRFYRGQMNRDTIQDWVVTVNTKDFAIKQLTESENLVPIDYGYLGNYNHIFVVDGKTGKWNGRPIGSSALAPLEIDIDYVNSDQYQLAKVFFRIGTSKFVAIYNSSIPSFQELFSWEIYNLSDPKNNGRPTAKIIEFVGPENGKKDIMLYEAEVVNFNDQEYLENMYSYEPQLKKTNKEPFHHFEYQLTQGKYGELNK
jgi:hypothetical protein